MNRIILFCVIVACASFQSVAANAPPIPQEVLNQITKGNLFTLIEWRVRNKVNVSVPRKKFLNPTPHKTFNAKFNNTLVTSAIFWFDTDNNLLYPTESNKQLAAGFVPNPYAFDIILKNSYGMSYEPDKYYKSGSDNFRKSYLGCDGATERFINDLYKLHSVNSSVGKDNVEFHKNLWREKISYKGTDARKLCYPYAYQLVQDYENFMIPLIADLRSKNDEFVSKEYNRTQEMQQQKKERKRLANIASQEAAEEIKRAEQASHDREIAQYKNEKQAQAKQKEKRFAEALAKWDHLEPSRHYLSQPLYINYNAQAIDWGNLAVFLTWLNTDIDVSFKSNIIVIENEFNGYDFSWVFSKLSQEGSEFLYLSNITVNGKQIPKSNHYRTILSYSISHQ